MTPSERAQALINPNIRTRVSDGHELPMVNGIKAIVGTPIPILLTLALVLVPLGEQIFTTTLLALCGLTIGYVLVDRLSANREFQFRWSPADVSLMLLTIYSLIVYIREPVNEWTVAAWPIVMLLISHCLDLFPGLNKRLWFWMLVTPMSAGFVLWQRLVGLTSDLSFLPNHWAESLSGLRTVGFFESAPAFTLMFASQLSFLTAAFFLLNSRHSNMLRGLFALGIGLCWLAIVTLESTAAMFVGLIAIVIVLLYFQRTYLTILLSLLTLAYLSSAADSLSGVARLTHWLEKGPDVTEQKRQVAQQQVEIFYNNPMLGEGLKSSIYQPVTSNLYLDLLRAGGMLGFLLFMITALVFLLKSNRLLQEIPSTHGWHRTYAAGLLGSQVSFLVLGLYHSPLQNEFCWLWLALTWALVHYMDSCYARRLVPDDSSI